MMQIKVKDTRMHKSSTNPKVSIEDTNVHGENGSITFTARKVPVVEGKLVLAECKTFESLLWENNGKFGLSPHYTRDIKNRYFKPITISETEKIEVGDWAYNLKTKELKQATAQDGVILSGMTWCKVLALPEHFSPKHLQAIVDGKLKDGDKVLVECEYTTSLPRIVDIKDLPQASFPPSYIEGYSYIKLNSSNHITLRKTEEKMYTKQEVIDIIEDFNNFLVEENCLRFPAKEWFEQNVK